MQMFSEQMHTQLLHLPLPLHRQQTGIVTIVQYSAIQKSCTCPHSLVTCHHLESTPVRERKLQHTRLKQRRKVCEDEEYVLTAAESLLQMSMMDSSCEDALRDASTKTDHVFPMLDPNYLVPCNQELSVELAALQEELNSMKHSLPKSPLQLMANSNQKCRRGSWLRLQINSSEW